MTQPGFNTQFGGNPNNIRLPRPSASSANRPLLQEATPPAPSRRQATPRQQTSTDLLKPVLYMLVANILGLVTIFAFVSLIGIPLGIATAATTFKFGARAVRMLLGKE
jgi:hypothetical protein